VCLEQKEGFVSIKQGVGDANMSRMAGGKLTKAQDNAVCRDHHDSPEGFVLDPFQYFRTLAAV